MHLKTQSIMTWILCVVFDTGYVGKTAWTSTGSTWSGRRYLVKADNDTSLTIERGDVKDSSSDEGLLSTLPSWCSFKGKISCCTDNWYRKCGFSYDSIFYCDLIRFDLIWFDLIWFDLFWSDFWILSTCHVLHDCLAQCVWYWYNLLGTRLLMLSIHRIFVTGVYCDSISGSATSGRVKSISVPSLWLSGSLPSSIGNFGNMTRMSFFENNIYGTIPSTISAPTSLQYLSLGSNSLVGTIPSTISALTSLQYLTLVR